ncbi:MAG: ABC transporter ATP-binding protein [Spirulinaceae cyanobacterium SM2_1_0]|nr:ABC transporter ATP-binding protein [Spirulinaceae cyanobacterium SM2_1_0]
MRVPFTIQRIPALPVLRTQNSELRTPRSGTNRPSPLQLAWQLVWRSSRALTLASLGLTVLQAWLPLVFLYITKRIIDAATVQLAARSPELEPILFWIILAGIAALALEVSASLATWVSEAQAQYVTDAVQNDLHAQSVAIDLNYYENASYYDSLHDAQTEAPYRPTLLLRRLLAVGQNGLALLAIAALLLALHWSATLLLLLATLPLAAVRWRYARHLHAQWQEWLQTERRAQYFSRLLTEPESAKEVRLFGLGDHLQAQFQTLRTQVRQARLQLSARRALAETLAQGVAIAALFLALAFLTHQTILGALTLGSLVMYYQALQRGQTLMRDLARNVTSLYEQSLFLTNLINFLALEPRLCEPAQPRLVPCPLQAGISFHQVSFRYPHSDRWILRDLSFRWQAGETLALVGENGAGKSTLVKLLCRLYEPTEGKICADGIDLREFATADWRSQIAAVFQDFVRYQLTVQETIGLGALASLENLAAIEQAAAQADLTGAIARLPQQYQTILGAQFESGTELSGGEWQKLALARALLRAAPIAILDEPTSALDPQAEATILAKFQQLAQARTTLLISHRLSTVKLADRILVLADGRIAESGHHAQLLHQQGLYAHLFETQARAYRLS